MSQSIPVSAGTNKTSGLTQPATVKLATERCLSKPAPLRRSAHFADKAVNKQARQRLWCPETARLRPRMEHHAALVHALGPRVLLELVLEIAAANDAIPDAADRLAAYATLTPAMLRAAGGDRFPPRRPRLVPRDGGAP